MADLTIYVDAQLAKGELQTMSGYKIPPSGKIIFENVAQGQGDLVISPKHPAITLPFCKSDGKTPKTLQAIPPDGQGGVKICDDFNGGTFLYTARIGQTIAEDPIVIIERPKLNYSDPALTLVAGALIGAGITYLIVKSRLNRTRPQQG
jgi:hypothetical protein